MKNEKKKVYNVPMVEIVEVFVERGFAGTVVGDDEEGTGGTTGGGIWG